MGIPEHKVIETLHNLIQVCKDNESGFRAAASATSDPDLASLLRAYAEQRRQFVTELQSAIHQIDGQTDGTPPASVASARCKMDFAVVAGDDEAIIAECQRGETCAGEAYQAALSLDLPVAVRSVIKAQFTQMELSRDKVRGLVLASA